MDQRADAELDATLPRTGDGAFVVGADSKIVAWNAAAERLLGYTAREAKGRSCCELFAGHDGNGNLLCYPRCAVSALAARGETIQAFDMRTRTKTGRPLWLNVSVLSAPGHGAQPRTLHLLRDVTATKELLALVHERIAAATPGADGDGAAATLTRRELEILRVLGEGLNTAGAADKLHVSRATVRNHVQNIFAKLGVHSRLAAVAYARRHRRF
jgi:PAS domain S-box-containing protein